MLTWMLPPNFKQDYEWREEHVQSMMNKIMIKKSLEIQLLEEKLNDKSRVRLLNQKVRPSVVE